jgi:hypothetical protein
VAQVISWRPFTSESRLLSQASPYKSNGRRNGIVTSFFFSIRPTSVFACWYYTTNDAHSFFVHIPLTDYCITLETNFSTPVQTGPGAHPASYTVDTGSFPRVKRPGRGSNHPLTPSAEVKERVELHRNAFMAGYRMKFTLLTNWYLHWIKRFSLSSSLSFPVFSPMLLFKLLTFLCIHYTLAQSDKFIYSVLNIFAKLREQHNSLYCESFLFASTD